MRVLLAMLIATSTAMWVTPAVYGQYPVVEYATPPRPSMPTFEQVEAYVNEQFPTTVHYKPGDLITKSDVEPVLAGLASIGWQVQRPDLILELVLDDNDYLVQQLRTSKGKKLYKSVSKYPGAIDHLDRMRDLKGGKKTLEVFVQKTPNNRDLIKTISTTKRGKKFAADIANFSNGKDFNKPTGRIYRVQELLISLRKLYDWESSLLQPAR